MGGFPISRALPHSSLVTRKTSMAFIDRPKFGICEVVGCGKKFVKKTPKQRRCHECVITNKKPPTPIPQK